MWCFQRQLLYHPNVNIKPPQSYNLHSFKEVQLYAADKTALQAWHHPSKDGFPTILFFHGNAGHLGDRAEFLNSLSQAGFGIFALSYRGFGGSKGSPSEEGLYQDARAAIEYARTNLKLSADKIILYGESLGTGVAIQMVIEFPTLALILQSPYTCISDRGQERYPFVPVSLLLKDRFDSLSKISNIRSPLLILHGEEDKVVPIEDGRILFAAAPFPKKAIYFPHKDHSDLSVSERVDALLNFASESLTPAKKPLKMLELSSKKIIKTSS
jgi:fermentation-respiration switch protein FrsA (DUF1100 family)